MADDFQTELIARYDRPAELDAVDRGDQHGSIGPVDARGDQDPGGLGHRLDDQHARHDRQPGPVSLEERLVHAHVLDGHDPSARVQLEHAIHQQEGITMRQEPHDPLDVDQAVFSQRDRLPCARSSF